MISRFRTKTAAGARISTLQNLVSALLLSATFTGCGGHSIASLPISPGSDTLAKSLMSLTLTRPPRSSASSSNLRRPEQIPNSVASVDMRVYSGSAVTNSALNTTCAPVSPGQTSITLSMSVQQGTDTLSVTSYSGACSPVAGGQGSIGSGTALTQFIGTGSVSPISTSINTVFNAGIPLVLGDILPQLQDIAVPVIWSASLGPVATYGSAKLNAFAIANASSATPTLYVGGGYGTADNVGTEAGAFRK